MITILLAYGLCGSIVWLFTADDISADVRLKRLVKGKRTRESHLVIASLLVVIPLWPAVAVKWIVMRGVWL